MTKVYIAILVHELGHNLGLRHNFMGSTDKDNFYTPEEALAMGLWNTPQSSSAMEYSNYLTELSVFGKYDIAALRFGYSRKVEVASSGELVKISSTLQELKDQLNQEQKSVKSYQFCTDENAGLSGLCNRFDEGTQFARNCGVLHQVLLG